MGKRPLDYVDHYLRRVNAGAQQRSSAPKFPTFCAQPGASLPLRRQRRRDCDGKATALPVCPVPLRPRNAHVCFSAVQVASNLRMRPRMPSDLTHDAGENVSMQPGRHFPLL
jgi:hypothetical protein